MLLNTGYLMVFIVNNNATGRVRHVCWLQETQKASRNPTREQEPQEIRKERGGSILSCWSLETDVSDISRCVLFTHRAL